MNGWTFDTGFAAAVAALVVGTLAGIITAAYPSDQYPVVVPFVAGLMGLALLIRKEAGIEP